MKIQFCGTEVELSAVGRRAGDGSPAFVQFEASHASAKTMVAISPDEARKLARELQDAANRAERAA